MLEREQLDRSPVENAPALDREVPSFEVSLKTDLAHSLFAGLREVYRKKRDRVLANGSSIAEFGETDLVRLVLYAVDKLGTADREHLDSVDLSLSVADANLIRENVLESKVSREGAENRDTALEVFDRKFKEARLKTAKGFWERAAIIFSR